MSDRKNADLIPPPTPGAALRVLIAEWRERAARAARAAEGHPGIEHSASKTRLAYTRCADDLEAALPLDTPGAALRAESEQLLLALCTVALNKAIADHLPYGMLERVQSYLRKSAALPPEGRHPEEPQPREQEEPFSEGFWAGRMSDQSASTAEVRERAYQAYQAGERWNRGDGDMRPLQNRVAEGRQEPEDKPRYPGDLGADDDRDGSAFHHLALAEGRAPTETRAEDLQRWGKMFDYAARRCTGEGAADVLTFLRREMAAVPIAAHTDDDRQFGAYLADVMTYTPTVDQPTDADIVPAAPTETPPGRSTTNRQVRQEPVDEKTPQFQATVSYCRECDMVFVASQGHRCAPRAPLQSLPPETPARLRAELKTFMDRLAASQIALSPEQAKVLHDLTLEDESVPPKDQG